MATLYKPHAAAIVAIRHTPETSFLLVRRAEEKLNGVWLYTAGKIEEGETAVQAALRELREETGLTPAALYTADMNETYYDRKHDVMRITPVFVAVVAGNSTITLDAESDAYAWLDLEAACARLMPMQQEVLRHIHKYFIATSPNPVLRLDKNSTRF